MPLTSIGGKLLEKAAADGIPYIVIPNTGIQPRLSLGFMFKGLLALMKEDSMLRETSTVAELLRPQELEVQGKELAQQMNGRIPVVYSSQGNEAIAYNWKIKFNETGKIPAFYNVFPELNHNEMTGFDSQETTKELSEKFHFILLADSSDTLRNQRRMEIVKNLYKDRGLPVTYILLEGKNISNG